jgi:hypothetical protein
MQTIPTINKRIIDTSQEVISWLDNQDTEKWNRGPEGKWDTSQHISHLIKTADMVTKGLSIPKIMLRWKFGKTNRPLRDSAAIIEKYRSKLAKTPPGTTFAASAGVSNTDKKEVIQQYTHSITQLNQTIDKSWSESALDKHLLPHPLMGRMPVRELLMWVSLHHIHHLDTLKTQY